MAFDSHAEPSSDGSCRVAAVMTVHNRRETTLACLRELHRQDRGQDVALDVLLVDDASTDGTKEAVTRAFPAVTVLDGDGGLYWNGGMRLAFGEALQGDYDYYLWLNDDTDLDTQALETLLQTCRDLRARGHERAIVVGSTRHPETGALTYGGVTRPSRLRPLRFELIPPSERPQPCETMNGNCVLIPRAVAERVGNLEPAYRQKMGDFDYGLRARAAGCSVWIAPGTLGTCATHPPRPTGRSPLGTELRHLCSTKELPFRPWKVFTQRWAGPAWPVYFASPYVRRGGRLVLDRVRGAVRGRST